ncbi:MAG: fimbrillin family protein [Bacteroidales bacterium]
MKKLIYLCCLLFPLIWNSCSKDDITIIVNPGEENSGKDEGGTNTTPEIPAALQKVSFFASVESMTQTRSLSAFPQGRFATVYGFKAGGDLAGKPYSDVNYISQTQGTLSPIDSNMYLPKGIYNFYSVATNMTKDVTPSFSGGISAPLQNGVDYLWWKSGNYSIESSSENIQIMYSHMSTQVVIRLKGGTDITINSIDSAKIIPSMPGATMKLSTGEIDYATTYSSSLMNMGINQNVCQYTLLPVKTNAPLNVRFAIKINGESVARSYAVNIMLPQGMLSGGKSYLFEAIVQGQEIVFPSVTIINWVTVDETGTPLYPSQI